MADVFCEIINGKIPTKFVYEDEQLVVFPDINPEAPVHLLIVPRQHTASVAELTENDAALAGHMLLVAKKMAEQFKVAGSGYRLVINHGLDGGQGVAHLHMHLIGGRKLSRNLS